MSEEALLLWSEGSRCEIENASKLVCFFGIPWRVLSVAEFLAIDGVGEGNAAKYRLICSASTFLKVMPHLVKDSKAGDLWRNCVHSVFVFAGDDSAALLTLARALAINGRVTLIERDRTDFVVSDKIEGIGDVMSGVRIQASNRNVRYKLICNPSNGGEGDVISAGDGAVFSKFEHRGIAVFVSTGDELTNVETELRTGIFDIRDHVAQALPIVLYLKWAFRKTCWHAVETNACLIIDDPLLTPNYGFVNFPQLLSLMKQHRFSTNIAFIPRNWRRNDGAIIRLFKENPEVYSISVHGCDHIRAEFGDPNPRSLRSRSRQALERMAHHEANTGLRHDRVMVFPQGVFSEAAIGVLKHTNFIAAANNDTLSADPCPRPIKVSDVWDVALMAYHNFPLFTRRYPWEGIENFAFDALLGKPMVAVIHHDFCSDQCARLVTFIQSLNALKTNLRWTSLGGVARRSYKRRGMPGAVPEIEMYASELTLENSSDEATRYAIRRSESDPCSITSIQAGAQPTSARYRDGHIRFEIELEPRRSTIVRVQFREVHHDEAEKKAFSTELRTTLRRRLCEVRDNYFMKYTPAFISQHFKVN